MTPVAILLLQSAQAVAVAPPDHAMSGTIINCALALILGLQAWVLRATTSLRDEMRVVTQALFGRRGDNGIERTVEEHGAELVDHNRRITDTEGRIDRIDPEQRVGVPDRRHV